MIKIHLAPGIVYLVEAPKHDNTKSAQEHTTTRLVKADCFPTIISIRRPLQTRSIKSVRATAKKVQKGLYRSGCTAAGGQAGS